MTMKFKVVDDMEEFKVINSEKKRIEMEVEVEALWERKKGRLIVKIGITESLFTQLGYCPFWGGFYVGLKGL